jgi:hypothetical protein
MGPPPSGARLPPPCGLRGEMAASTMGTSMANGLLLQGVGGFRAVRP